MEGPIADGRIQEIFHFPFEIFHLSFELRIVSPASLFAAKLLAREVSGQQRFCCHQKWQMANGKWKIIPRLYIPQSAKNLAYNTRLWPSIGLSARIPPLSW